AAVVASGVAGERAVRDRERRGEIVVNAGTRVGVIRGKRTTGECEAAIIQDAAASATGVLDSVVGEGAVADGQHAIVDDAAAIVEAAAAGDRAVAEGQRPHVVDAARKNGRRTVCHGQAGERNGGATADGENAVT